MSILANPSGGAGGLQRCSTAVVTRGLIIHAGDTQGHCSRISSKLGHCSSLCKYFLHAVDINDENITKYFLVTISLVLTTPQTCIQTNVTGHSQGSAVCSVGHHTTAGLMTQCVLQCCSAAAGDQLKDCQLGVFWLGRGGGGVYCTECTRCTVHCSAAGDRSTHGRTAALQHCHLAECCSAGRRVAGPGGPGPGAGRSCSLSVLATAHCSWDLRLQPGLAAARSTAARLSLGWRVL